MNATANGGILEWRCQRKATSSHAKSCPNTTFCATNLIRTGPVTHPVFHGDRTATNRLSNGTSHVFVTQYTLFIQFCLHLLMVLYRVHIQTCPDGYKYCVPYMWLLRFSNIPVSGAMKKLYSEYNILLLSSTVGTHWNDTTTDRTTCVQSISNQWSTCVSPTPTLYLPCTLFRGILLSRLVADVQRNEFKSNRNRFC
jgi:hypothetical protein